MKRIAHWLRLPSGSMQGLMIVCGVSIVLLQPLTALILVCIFFLWLIGGKYRQTPGLFREQRFITSLFGVLFLLYLAGLLYSHNLTYGLTDVLLKSPLFLFPLVMSTGFRREEMPELYKKVTLSFTISALALSIVLIAKAILADYHGGDASVYYYATLSGPFHPSYLAMYIVFAMSVILWMLVSEKGKLRSGISLVWILSLVWLFVFVILLSSRAGVLSLMMVFVATGVYILTEKKDYLRGSLFLLGFVALFYTTYLAIPAAFGRARNTAKSVHNTPTDPATADGTAQRILIWETSIELIKDHILLGVGTGDVKDELLKAYKAKGMTNVFERRKNVHNQFLQTFTAIGLPGFIVLMMGFLVPGLYAIWRRDLLYFLFLMTVGFNFLFESMLERQAGVFFYAFFNAVLFFAFPGKKLPETQMLPGSARAVPD